MTEGPYKVVAVAFGDLEDLTAALNSLHTEGWDYQGHSLTVTQGPPPLCRPQKVAIVVLRQRAALTAPTRIPGLSKQVYGEAG